jgi:hypothetical protein
MHQPCWSTYVASAKWPTQIEREKDKIYAAGTNGLYASQKRRKGI